MEIRQSPETLKCIVDSFWIDLLDRTDPEFLGPKSCRQLALADILLLEFFAGCAVPFLRAREVILIAEISGRRAGRWLLAG